MSAFKNYVTSTAFRLSLTKTQIEIIGHVFKRCERRDSTLCELESYISSAILFELLSKGLVIRSSDGWWGISHEGKLVVQLLFAAGLLSRKESPKISAAA